MTSQPSIVFLDRATLPVAIRAPALPLQWQEYENTLPEQVLERLAQAEVAISNKVLLREDTLKQLPRLKLIAISATGTNNVDLDYCRAHNIAVCNVRGYSTHSVAEHVFSLLLALRRNVLRYHANVLAGAWQQAEHFVLHGPPIHDLHGDTLGIYGLGDIGHAVKHIAEAMGMNVLVSEHKGAESLRPDRVPFDRMLAESDVVTLHCPLVAETRNLIAESELRRMKPAAILLNLARGGIVDETTLARAIHEKWIAGAAIDVLTTEPPREGNPLLEVAGDNCIITPHVAWASQQAMSRLGEEIVCNIEAFYAGQSRNRIV